jgi:hypothetical protein
VWRGRGVAFYPTIDTTHYREELAFQDHPDAPRIQYEQKTWRIHADGSESLLHWEFGFLMLLGDDALQWINAQNNGRVEVMMGNFSDENGVFLMEVGSTAFANDPRMVESSRRVEVSEGRLRYVQMMSTTTTESPSMQVHLEAELTRA